MATLNYNVNVNATQGIQALQQLQSKVVGTNEAFGKLKNAFAGLVAASVVKSAFEAANAMSDLSNASNIAIESILGFKKAVKAAGGDTADIEQGIGRLSQAIETASQGSKDMQDRFLKLGITLQDLRTMSEGELLQKVVDGLGKGTAGAQTMATGISFFGKSFRSVNWGEVAGSIGKTSEESKKAADSYRMAGESFQKFQTAMGKIQATIIQALAPIADGISKILDFSDSISYLIKTAVQIGIVIASFTALGKIIQWGRLLVVGLIEGWAALTGAFSVATNAFKNWGAISATVNEGLAIGGSRIGIFGGILKELGSAALKSIPGLGALAGAIAIVGGIIWDAIKGLGTFLGILSDEKAKTDDTTKSQQDKANALRDVTDALLKEKSALDNIVTAYKLANDQANKKYQAETLGITMSEKQKEAYNQQLDAYNRYLTEFNKLQDQFNEKRQSGSESDKRMLPEISATMDQLTKEYYKQKDVIDVLVESRTRETQLKQLDLFNTKAMIDSQNKLRDIQDEIAKSTMSELEKKYYDIDAAARASAKSAIEAEEARRNAKMPIEEQQRYYDAAIQSNEELSSSFNEELKKQTKESYDNSRSAATGWAKAFNSYRDNATNAAEEAQRVFSIMAQGMEDALMNFIKRGKFEWKNFVQLMVDELLRSQIRQLIGNIGGGLQTASSGLMGGLGKLLGFAGGGIIPTNGPVVVGERGPEILSGVGGRVVTPNNALGGSSNVVYNISAVDAMSFRQMVARDPSFLYAVTEQGRRSLPGGR